MKQITPMQQWLLAATPNQREALASNVGTAVNMLYQYAGGHRQASAERAGEIERTAAQMSKALPSLYRTDLCEACRRCPYAQQVLGPRATVSEFPVLKGD